MEGLLEANKVASLMRRRENPKQLAFAQLVRLPAMEPRPAAVAGGFPAPRAAAGLPHRKLAVALPGIACQNATLKPVRPIRAQVRVSSRAALRMAASKAISPIQPQRTTMAFAAQLCVDSRRPSRPVPIPRTIAPARKSIPSPGFRSRAPLERKAGRRRKSLGGLGHGWLRPTRLRNVAVPVKPALCTIRLRRQLARVPALRVRGPFRDMGQRDTMRLLLPVASGSPSPKQEYAAAVREKEPQANGLGLRIHALRHPQRTERGAIPFPFEADAGCRTHRLAEVAFVPDSPFDHPPRKLHGSAARSAGGSTQAQTPGLIEESFHSGLDRWNGDTSGWRLDAAGAHPVGLGLFQPSLTWRDYDFEFRARISKRGITFVFRAANLSNYYRVNIRVSDSGRQELRRSVVIGGMEEPAVIVPLRAGINTGPAFTIKVCALRNDFKISWEGEAVAQWTDGRLPGGGIGFTAARGEEARIYWIKLAPLGGSPHSEAAPGRLSRST